MDNPRFPRVIATIDTGKDNFMFQLPDLNTTGYSESGRPYRTLHDDGATFGRSLGTTKEVNLIWFSFDVV